MIVIRFIVGLIVLFLISMIVLIIIAYSLDLNQYKLTLVKFFNEHNELKLDIRGPIEFELHKKPRLIFSNVIFSSSTQNMNYAFQAKKAIIDLNWKSLLGMSFDHYDIDLNEGSLKIQDSASAQVISNFYFQNFSAHFGFTPETYEFKNLNYHSSENAFEGELFIKRHLPSDIHGALSIAQLNLPLDLKYINFKFVSTLNLNLVIRKLTINDQSFNNLSTKLTYSQEQFELIPVQVGSIKIELTGNSAKNIVLRVNGKDMPLNEKN